MCAFRIFLVFQDAHSGQTPPGSAPSLASAGCSLNSVGLGLGGSGVIEGREIVISRGRDFGTLDGISGDGARELPETDLFMMQNSVLLPHHPPPQYGEGFSWWLYHASSGSSLHRGAGETTVVAEVPARASTRHLIQCTGTPDRTFRFCREIYFQTEDTGIIRLHTIRKRLRSPVKLASSRVAKV